jgi:hypothetical protein
MILLLSPPHAALAQIAFGAVGTAASGTTSLSVPYPAGISAGDLLVSCIASKYPTNGPSTPSGWTLPAGGQGSGGDGLGAGLDQGDVYATVFTRVADGSETGNLSISIPSGNAAYAIMARYTKTLGGWAVAARSGVDSTGDTSWSVLAAADPGVTAGDIVATCTAINTDLAGYSAHAMTQTGITYGAANERADNGTSLGDDVGLKMSDHVVSSGTSSGAPTYTSSIASGAPEGASVFLRLREVASGSSATPRGLLLGVYP